MARVFNGSNQSMYSPSDPVGSSEVFTLSCWAYPVTDGAAEQAVVSYGPSGAASPYIMLGVYGSVANDPVIFAHWTGGSWLYSQHTGVTFNAWNHFCGVSSAIDYRQVYLNGDPGTPQTGSSSLLACNRVSIAVTADSTPNYYYPGRVCDFSMWSAALTAAEVLSLAYGVSPLLVRPQSLVFYAPLWRTEDVDYVGGQVLTVNNSPTVGNQAPLYGRAMPFYTLSGGAAPATRIPRYGFTNFQIPAVV